MNDTNNNTGITVVFGAYLGSELVDTPDTDDEGEFGFIGDVIVSFAARLSSQTDLLALLEVVLAYVALGALEDLLSLLSRARTPLDSELKIFIVNIGQTNKRRTLS